MDALAVEGLSADAFALALLRHASDAISVTERESGRFVVVSDSYCALTGYAREQLIGRTSLELGLIADHAARSPALGVLSQSSGVTYEVELHRQDGASRAVEFSVQLLPGERLVLAICRDATARRDAHSRLRASEERFHTAVESLPDPFYILSPVHSDDGAVVDFRYEYASPAGYALAGPRQVLGRRVSEVDPTFLFSTRFGAYRQVIASGEPCRIEVVVPAAGSPGGALKPRLLEISVASLGENLAVCARDVTELRGVQVQLLASEERFRAAVESMLDSFAIVSPVRDEEGAIVDFRYEYVNDAHCALTGFDREHLLGRRLGELFAGYRGSARFEQYRQVALTGDPARSEDVTDAGAWVGTGLAGRVMDTMIVSMGESLVVSARDVSERYAAELALRASEQRFRAVADSMLESFAMFCAVRDGNGEIVDFRVEYVNDAYCEALGASRDELTGQRMAELYPGLRTSPRLEVYRRVVESGEPIRLDSSRSDPTWAQTGLAERVLDTIAVAVGDHLILTGRDITDRVEVEHRLALQAQLLELAHDAILVRDPAASRVTFWNRGAEALYGFGRDEALGSVTHKLLATVFPQSQQAVDRALIEHGQWEGDLRHTRKDGRVIVVASRQALQRDADGRPTAVIELNSDVTERRDAERHIRELNRDLDRRAVALEAANAELESFSYSVAHDLRTPLRAIAGFSELLGTGGHIANDDERGRALLARTRAAAGRMGELIDALLELARLSRSQFEITRVDLSAISGEIADQLHSSGEPRAVEFAIEPGLHAAGDQRLVRILLRCLLENAWKYSSAREHARIELVRAGPDLFAVRDNGAGFDMEFAEQLFKPFGRLHRQDEFPGTGVGLAIAERIVRRHGGTLRGEGRVGHGAAFYFSLQLDHETHNDPI